MATSSASQDLVRVLLARLVVVDGWNPLSQGGGDLLVDKLS